MFFDGLIQTDTFLPNLRPDTFPITITKALSRGDFNQVPVIEGTNADERRLFRGMALLAGAPPARPDNYKARMQRVLDVSSGKAQAIAEEYPLDDYPNPGWALGAAGTDAIYACPGLAQVRKLSQYVLTYAYEFADRDAPRPYPCRITSIMERRTLSNYSICSARPRRLRTPTSRRRNRRWPKRWSKRWSNTGRTSRKPATQRHPRTRERPGRNILATIRVDTCNSCRHPPMSSLISGIGITARSGPVCSEPGPGSFGLLDRFYISGRFAIRDNSVLVAPRLFANTALAWAARWPR